MSQQYSLQKALPNTIRLKNIALSSHASFRENCTRKSFLVFYWVLPNNISNIYDLQIISSLKLTIQKEILNCVLESQSPGFSKFSVIDEQK